MSNPFPAESLYRLILMKTYDDSFGGYNFSDYVDYTEDADKSKICLESERM